MGVYRCTEALEVTWLLHAVTPTVANNSSNAGLHTEDSRSTPETTPCSAAHMRCGGAPVHAQAQRTAHFTAWALTHAGT